ncbi:MAG TPA: FHA domain-containing protein [Acidimicrobiales bacterium]|nr:FHA domain-containing protein [Acidimicrobiales bacterium]
MTPDDCPVCKEPRGDADRFCGHCGFSFREALLGWHAIVTADRGRFEAVAPDGVAFPVDYEPWTLVFSSDRFTLGRQTLPGDPGISRRHADIIRTPEGCSVEDLESTNGTKLNDTKLTPHVAVPLCDGDRVQVGAWTTLTIQAPSEADDDDDD